METKIKRYELNPAFSKAVLRERSDGELVHHADVADLLRSHGELVEACKAFANTVRSVAGRAEDAGARHWSDYGKPLDDAAEVFESALSAAAKIGGT